MTFKESCRRAGLGALIFGASIMLALALATPPSPFAAADRFFARAAWEFFAPPRPQSRDVVIIAIGDETLSALPYRSPIDRGFLARIIETLERDSVRAIGLDVIFDQPTEPTKDALLRAALDRAPAPIILLSVASETPLSAARRRYLDRFLAGRLSGYGNLARERFDDRIQLHVPVHPITGRPSFPAAIAHAVGLPVPDRPFGIAWRAPPSRTMPAFPTYPAEAVSALPREWLAGKIVLIGATLPGEDEHRTLVSGFGPPTYGVEIHAHVLSQILGGRFQTGLPWTGLLLVTAVGTIAGMTAAGFLSGWALVPALLGLVLLPWAGALASFAEGGPLLPSLAPTLGVVFGGGGMRFWRGRRERRERRTLMQLFSRFVSAPVVTQIWEARDLFLAGGRPRPQELTASVLFSDIAGFTPICEGLPPDPLIAWLDRYIDTMVQIVLDHDGVVLRFIGDGILAVFGAPLARVSEDEIDRDARNAARCALAMRAAMERLNAGWRAEDLPSAAVRVGIHTGSLVAGGLGNGPHMEYCLLGDTANTAARLEALGKQHAQGPEDSVILIGEPTWRRLDGFEGVPVGTVELKGKQTKVAVWRLLDTPARRCALPGVPAPTTQSRSAATRKPLSG